MITNIDVLHRAVVRSCGDAPDYFVESVSGAFAAMFEDGETIPVNPQNLATSPDANTIPAQLKDAQTAAKNLEDEKQKADTLQNTLNEKVSDLRDTLGVASQNATGTSGTNGTNAGTNGTNSGTTGTTNQGTTNATA